MSENNNFLRDYIDLSIDGFLFRGITPSDHYYRFSKSFPRAFTLPSNLSTTAPKQSNKHQRTKTISSFNSNSLPEQKSVLTDYLTKTRTTQSLSKTSTVLTDPSISELNRLEIEVHDIEERMRKQRLKHNRPDDLSKMTIEQISHEKISMQQELLKFENKYSKPTLSEQKKIVKPIYDYYRQLKRLAEK
jgi:hypothetical protein